MINSRLRVVVLALLVARAFGLHDISADLRIDVNVIGRHAAPRCPHPEVLP